MPTVSLEEAQARLSELVHQLAPGEEVIVTENQRPVARISSITAAGVERKLGTLRGTVLYMAPDFDAPLDEFEDYMQ
ncbi:MAG: type II toxin-antitoxin system prevent-host-death family antitoxin [Pirellulales bacterium]